MNMQYTIFILWTLTGLHNIFIKTNKMQFEISSRIHSPRHRKTRTLTCLSSKKEQRDSNNKLRQTELKQRSTDINLNNMYDGNTNKQFYLQEQYATHYAKCELHQISENFWVGDEATKFGGWALDDEKAFRIKVLEGQTQSRKTSVKQPKLNSTDNTCLLLSGLQRGRAKTQTAYHSLKTESSKKEVPDQIKSLINISLHCKREREQCKRYTKNQVVRIMPQILDSENNNIQHNKVFSFSDKFKSVNKNKICHSMATTLIQVPFGNCIRNKKIKGSNYGKNNYQKNIFYRKVNNTLALQKKSEEQKEKNPFQQISQKMQIKNINQSNLNHILRRTFLNLQENRKAKQSLQAKKENPIFPDSSPIRQDLEKLKKLLKGQHYNYMQINSSCPIKIQGLVSSQAAQNQNYI